MGWHKSCLEAMLERLRAGEAYAVLGLLPTATDAEIAHAYKSLAVRLHPDKGGDAEQFKRLRGAYDRILAARKGSSKASSSGGSSQPRSASTSCAAAAPMPPQPAAAQEHLAHQDKSA